MEESDLEQQYLAAAILRAEYLGRNRAQAANREFDEMHRLLKEGLRRLPDRGEAALKRITQYPNVEVQISAAADLLVLDESYAVQTLERIAKRKAPGSFTAEMTLREWRKGNLREYLS